VSSKLARRRVEPRWGTAAARALALAALFVAACGSDPARDARGPSGRPPGSRVVRQIDPPDLFPADLDLILRVDVARMNAAIGPAAASELSARASLRGEGEGQDELLKEALSRAQIVWIGLRLADIDAGDRVLVAEGKLGGLRPDPAAYQPVAADIEGISIAERADVAPRAGTAQVIQLGDRAMAFVSPMEVDSVARVLRDGPDKRRGDPAREGIVSVDLRPRRLPVSLERRFPSIGAIIAGIKRVRAAVIPTADGVRLDAEISARSKPAAERVLRFLKALRDNVADPERKGLMKELSIEHVGEAVRVRWTLPARALASLVQAPLTAPPAQAPLPKEGPTERRERP
jgi:hypothetical protein